MLGDNPSFLVEIAKLFQDNPSPALIMFGLLVIATCTRPILYVIDWFRNKKKIDADSNAVMMEAFMKMTKQNSDDTKGYMDSMSHGFKAELESHKEEIRNLKQEICNLKEEIRKLQESNFEKNSINAILDSRLKMKDHEILMLRGWAKRTLIVSCEKCRNKFGLVPDSLENIPNLPP